MDEDKNFNDIVDKNFNDVVDKIFLITDNITKNDVKLLPLYFVLEDFYYNNLFQLISYLKTDLERTNLMKIFENYQFLLDLFCEQFLNSEFTNNFILKFKDDKKIFHIYELIIYKKNIENLKKEVLKKEKAQLEKEKAQKFYTKNEIFSHLIKNNILLINKLKYFSKNFSQEHINNLKQIYSEDYLSEFKNNPNLFLSTKKKIDLCRIFVDSDGLFDDHKLNYCKNYIKKKLKDEEKDDTINKQLKSLNKLMNREVLDINKIKDPSEKFLIYINKIYNDIINYINKFMLNIKKSKYINYSKDFKPYTDNDIELKKKILINLKYKEFLNKNPTLEELDFYDFNHKNGENIFNSNIYKLKILYDKYNNFNKKIKIIEDGDMIKTQYSSFKIFKEKNLYKKDKKDMELTDLEKLTILQYKILIDENNNYFYKEEDLIKSLIKFVGEDKVNIKIKNFKKNGKLTRKVLCNFILNCFKEKDLNNPFFLNQYIQFCAYVDKLFVENDTIKFLKKKLLS